MNLKFPLTCCGKIDVKMVKHVLYYIRAGVLDVDYEAVTSWPMGLCFFCLFQVVCDSNLKFLDVYTGNVESVHDSRVFRNSDINSLLESNEEGLPAKYHILGDSAYPLKDYLLVPLRDNGHLNCLSQT